jgi:predicted nucleic acid-binding protein
MSVAKRAFIDTNVIVYLASGDARKADRSEKILAAGGVLSVQVLNEYVSVARRKLALSWTETREVIAAVKSACEIVPLSVEAQAAAMRISEISQLSIYDASIVAAALEAGCDTLLSEDMQHGQKFETLSVVNPYRSLK